MIAASLLIYGHSFTLAALDSGQIDFVSHFLGYRYSGDIAVAFFFLISGLVVGWPIQQLIARWDPAATPHLMTAIALPFTWLVALLSWRVVEERLLTPPKQWRGKRSNDTASVSAVLDAPQSI